VQVSHHLLLSHAEAVRAFEEHRSGGGSIGITLVLFPCHPASERGEDREAARTADGHYNRWFLDPVLTGDYPADMVEHYARLGRAPEIRPEDAEAIRRASIDFLGVNYYYRWIVRAPRSQERLFEVVPPEGRDTRFTAMGWEIYPEGLYETLIRVRGDYRNLPLYVTENGAAFDDRPGEDGWVEDGQRIEFLREHFAQAARAIADGVDLRGYQVWSLFDNFEWAYGYEKRFGVVRIDFESQARIWKKSARWYRDVIAGSDF
jgi:beta-glucosidase